MKISKYLMCFLKDLFATCGFLMIIATIFLEIYSVKISNTSLLWQILLIASAYTFFKFALVNKYELEKNAQLISFCVCFILADVMVILWLVFFSPGKLVNTDLIIIYIAAVLVVKGGVYAMLYSDSHKQAKRLNEKLNEYKNGENE